MRMIGWAVAAAVGAALAGAALGWAAWELQDRPRAAAPALALIHPAFPPPAEPDTPGRPAIPSGPRWNSRNGDGRPRLAIVIDDIGHSLWPVEHLLALDVPLTFSILPDLPHTRDAERRIRQAGREYIIHLPMEPEDYPARDPGPNALLLGLTLDETRERLREYLAQLPHAVGASNHMGSAYTGDEPRMALVQGELARRGMFFLNSKTSATPIPAHIAGRGGYRYLSRDVFLDNEIDAPAIEQELRRAAQRARRRGAAIAIGHPHGETLAALAGAIGRGELDGVELVSLSELVK